MNEKSIYFCSVDIKHIEDLDVAQQLGTKFKICWDNASKGMGRTPKLVSSKGVYTSGMNSIFSYIGKVISKIGNCDVNNSHSS